MSRKGMAVVMVLLVSLLLAACGQQGAAPAKGKAYSLKFGSTSVRSGLYANTVAMAGVINKAYPNDILVTVVETGGYVENLERMRGGSVHAGPASTGAAAASYLGILDWQGKPDQKLRTLWGGYFTPIHLVASKKSGISTLEGFAGRPFAMNPGTTSGWHMEYFLKALDVKPDLKLMGLGASPDAMKAGVVDGWFKAGFKDAAVLDIEAAMEITIVPVTRAQMDKADKAQPGLHRSMNIPAGLFKAVKAEQLSYAYVIGDFIRSDVPEDVVYKAVKAVWDSRPAIIEPLATLKEGKFDEMVGNARTFGLKVPFHAGAVKFYKEVGQTIPAELLPPEVKK